MEHYGISVKIGPLWTLPGAGEKTDSREGPEIPMYSYERPAYILWGGVYDGLRHRGWTDEEAREWLRSKHPRWELDGVLGDALESIGKLVATRAEKVIEIIR